MPLFDTQVLENNAVDISTFAQLSNIGEIGMAPDFSQNQLANDFQNRFPLLDWLFGTPRSTQVQRAFNNGSAQIHRSTDKKLNIVLPWEVGTTLPEDTNNECCWTPLDIQKCGSEVPLMLLCLKDCDKILENLVWSTKRFGSNDLTGYFARQGETVKEARDRMARLSMAYFTSYNIINGTSTTGTTVLKPFHGLLEVMEDKSVIKILGSNILAAFDSLGCRLSVVGGTTSAYDIVFAVHPLTYLAIKEVIVPGKFNGELPANWTKDANGNVMFMGHRFIEDKTVPVDVTKGVGDVWVIDGGSTGVVMGTDLIPSESFIRRTVATTDTPSDGCATECTFYYNFGAVFNTNPNRMAVITDIPLSANCLGATLNGLDSLITPQTIVPINKASV
jgi:hypothetical protein